MASKNTALVKLVGDNHDLRQALQDSERRVKGLEKAVARTRNNTKGAFSPLTESALKSLGPLGTLTKKLHGVAAQVKNVSSESVDSTAKIGGLAGRFGKLGEFASRNKGALMGVGAAIAGIGAAGTFVDGAIEKLKALAGVTRTLKRETGMSAEMSSAWIGIGDRMGVSADKLSTSFGIFSKKLAPVMLGTGKGSEKMAKVFEDLSVSSEAIANGDMDTVLMNIADAFKAMPDGAIKTKTAMELFGRGGKAMIPILNQGSEGLGELKKEMSALGLTIGDDTLERTKDLTKSQKVLNQVWEGVQIQVATKLIPFISKFAVKFKELVVQFREGKGTGGKIREVFEKIGKAAGDVWKEFGPLLKSIGKFITSHPDLMKVIGAMILFKMTMRSFSFVTPTRQLGLFMKGVNALGRTNAGSKAISAITGPFKSFGSKMGGIAVKGGGALRQTFLKIAGNAGRAGMSALQGGFKMVSSKMGAVAWRAGNGLSKFVGSARTIGTNAANGLQSVMSANFASATTKARFGSWGKGLGKIFGRGLAVGTVLGLYQLLKETPLSRYSGKKGWGTWWKDMQNYVLGGGPKLFASGGIVNRATVAVVGEAGPEAIIPLSPGRRARGQQLYAEAGRALGMTGTGHSMTFNVVNNGNQLDEQALASKLAWQLQTRGI